MVSLTFVNGYLMYPGDRSAVVLYSRACGTLARAYRETQESKNAVPTIDRTNNKAKAAYTPGETDATQYLHTDLSINFLFFDRILCPV